MRVLLCAATALLVTSASVASAAILVFDDFNVDAGHFGSAPNFSGSNANIHGDSTSGVITTDSFEGAGSMEINVVATNPGAATRLRFLSGVAAPANNISFETGPGVDGWIGLALKTTDPGWTAQIWIEPSNVAPAAVGHNGSVPKEIIADGEWHIYDWNLDDNSGGPDGWGDITGVTGGTPIVGDGNHTIDSVLFRHAAAPATSTIYMDWVVLNDSGRVIPEPTSIAIALLGCLAVLGLARRR